MGINESNVTQKAWGWSEAQVVSPLCEVHRIDVNPGGYCSVHQHDRKHNVFTLVLGSIRIYEWDEGADHDGAPSKTTVLENPGDSYDVPPGRVHQFHAIGYARVIETYYPAGVAPEDIFRFSLGGHGIE